MTMPTIPHDLVSALDYERAAQKLLGEGAWAYISGGVADEITLARNRAAFDEIRLEGRVLADMTGAHTRTSFLGLDLPFPVMVAPMAFQRLAHPAGEAETAVGAAALGIPMVVSTQTSVPLAEINRATCDAPFFFQLYPRRDRAETMALVAAARTAGCRALVVTVDAPVNGMRNREQRAGFTMPADVRPALLDGFAPQPRIDVPPGGSPVFAGMLEGAPTWPDIEWLVAEAGLPVILKGIMAAADAEHAVQAGVAAIAVSNHGGRTLDGLPATMDLLPQIAERIDGRIPILLDGGIRRGTDVLKALALGASAVLVGRPILHAVAVAGAAGVAHLLAILRTELEVAMALTGRPTIEAIDGSVIWKSR